jgi:hypothetical protein
LRVEPLGISPLEIGHAPHAQRAQIGGQARSDAGEGLELVAT